MPWKACIWLCSYLCRLFHTLPNLSWPLKGLRLRCLLNVTLHCPALLSNNSTHFMILSSSKEPMTPWSSFLPATQPSRFVTPILQRRKLQWYVGKSKLDLWSSRQKGNPAVKKRKQDNININNIISTCRIMFIVSLWPCNRKDIDGPIEQLRKRRLKCPSLPYGLEGLHFTEKQTVRDAGVSPSSHSKR